jgi:AcrR family transcriptional regulator
MSAVEEELGLRERKRRATRRAIQHAALELATERGFDRVTIDEISHAANVSPRTFFNYFPSKESAIIGEVPEIPDTGLIDAFVDAGPEQSVLTGLQELLVATVDNSEEVGSNGDDDDEDNPSAHSLHELRRQLLTRNPELFALRMASMHQFERELCDVVERRLEADSRKAGRGSDVATADTGAEHVDGKSAARPQVENIHQRARLITFIGFAAMRHAWSCWADGGGAGPLADRLRDSFGELRATLAAEALRELQPV